MENLPSLRALSVIIEPWSNAIVGQTTRLAFTKKYFARVLQGHRPTFTHGDVQQKNIMVVENTSRPDDQGGRSFDIVLVDWENAGWFPDFWE